MSRVSHLPNYAMHNEGRLRDEPALSILILRTGNVYTVQPVHYVHYEVTFILSHLTEYIYKNKENAINRKPMEQ